jgi:hypothetical protein
VKAKPDSTQTIGVIRFLIQGGLPHSADRRKTIVNEAELSSKAGS